MSHSAHALNAVERAELTRLEALIEAGASQDLPAGEVQRIYYVRGVLRDTWQFLLKTGTELASAIRTWLPVDGMPYVISPAVAAPMMLRVSDTACMFDTVALPPCLLLANPQLAGDGGPLLAGDGGPLERIARRVLADQVGAREIANCLATWPELRVSLCAVVDTYVPVAAHYGWDAEREEQQPQPLAAAALAAFEQALAVLAATVERFRGPASPPDTASPPDATPSSTAPTADSTNLRASVPVLAVPDSLIRSADELCSNLASASEPGQNANPVLVMYAQFVCLWATLVEVHHGGAGDDPPRRVTAAFYGLWRFLCAAEALYTPARQTAFRRVRDLRPFRLDNFSYPCAVDAVLIYGKELLTTAQKLAAPDWRPFSKDAGPFPMDAFVTHYAELERHFADMRIADVLSNVGGTLQLELASVEMASGTAGQEEPADNADDYLPATHFLDDKFPDYKSIRKALAEHPWIRRRRPKTKDGREDTRRLCIHPTDWQRFKEARKTPVPLDVAEAVAEVEERKQAEEERKQAEEERKERNPRI